MALVQALASALLMNIAIVGINQLYDIEIDKASRRQMGASDAAGIKGSTLAAGAAGAGLRLKQLAVGKEAHC